MTTTTPCVYKPSYLLIVILKLRLSYVNKCKALKLLVAK